MKNKQIFDLNIQNILHDWSVSDAIREIIANAIDEANLTATQSPKVDYNEVNKVLTISDFGRGIRIENFSQNENNEKTNSKQMIGKFGIGLKDSIAVLFNSGKNVIFTSAFGHFCPILANKSGIDEQIRTIHIQYNPENKIAIGTTVTIENCSKDEYLKALDNFLIFAPPKSIFKCEIGEIFIKNDISSEIFLNGMKISNDDDFLFSYNITNPDSKLKASINRERKSLSRSIYSNSIIKLLSKAIENKTNPDLATWISDYILKNCTNTKNNEWSYVAIKKLVVSKTSQKILLASRNGQINPSFETYARDNGYAITWIDETDYSSFLSDKEVNSCTLDDWGQKFISNYEGKVIDINDLEEFEKSNWLWAKDKLELISQKWPEFKYVYSKFKLLIIDKHPNALGITSMNKIEIVRMVLKNKRVLFNTLIHEYCHAISNAPDASIRFEATLTEAFSYILDLNKVQN